MIQSIRGAPPAGQAGPRPRVGGLPRLHLNFVYYILFKRLNYIVYVVHRLYAVPMTQANPAFIRLSPEQASASLDALRPWLGTIHQRRLALILERANADGTIPMDQALATSFPEQSHADALGSLRQLRFALAASAKAGERPLALAVDTKTRSATAQRILWFEGPDRAEEEAAEFSKRATEDAERIVENRGIPVPPQPEPIDMAVKPRKTTINLFVSYAHQDAAEKRRVLDMLKPALSNHRLFTFRFWADDAIHAGEEWKTEILAAMEKCHFGLLFTSPRFFASEFIREVELPWFAQSEDDHRQPKRPCIPVALIPFAMNDSFDLGGLPKHQIFFHPPGRSFLHHTGRLKQNDFVNQLGTQIINRALKLKGTGALPEDDEPPAAIEIDSWIEEDLRARAAEDVAHIKHYARTRGRPMEIKR